MGHAPKVLIVEDDVPTQHLLSAVAHRNHFRTELAADGRAALKSLGSADYDVILLDLILPEVDGFAVLRQIAATMPHLMPRTIVVSAAAQVGSSDGEEQLGDVFTVVRKPFELSALERQMLACSARGRM